MSGTKTKIKWEMKQAVYTYRLRRPPYGREAWVVWGYVLPRQEDGYTVLNLIPPRNGYKTLVITGVEKARGVRHVGSVVTLNYNAPRYFELDGRPYVWDGRRIEVADASPIDKINPIDTLKELVDWEHLEFEYYWGDWWEGDYAQIEFKLHEDSVITWDAWSPRGEENVYGSFPAAQGAHGIYCALEEWEGVVLRWLPLSRCDI